MCIMVYCVDVVMMVEEVVVIYTLQNAIMMMMKIVVNFCDSWSGSG